MNAKSKYNSLNEKSVWSYTKQKAYYSDLFNSSKLFDEIPNKQSVTIEDYFAKNFKKYGISTNRHRILAIAQMFGLITKDPYYLRGGSTYSNEKVTPVYDALKKHTINGPHFNKILSEQLLKIKVKSIIDTTSFRDDYNIYPFIFLFLVMWKLDKKYGMKLVPMNKLWTYVLTCKSMDEVDDAVKWMVDPSAKISPFVTQYKSDSRFMTLFFECTRMFSLKKGLLSLNYPLARDFYNKFILKQNLTVLESFLHNDSKYKDYLENLQGFDFDLIGTAPSTIIHSRERKHPIFSKKSSSKNKDVSVIVPSKPTEEVGDLIDAILDMEDEQDVKEASVYDSKEDIEKSNNRAPVLKSGLESNKRYATDPRLAKTAIKNAGYVCELSGLIGNNHTTFNSTHGTKYLEAHHLVPMKAQKDFISSGINLDRLENIVALCPNCHKAVHYGTKAEKIKYLRPLYKARIKKLNALGIKITFNILINEYYK